MNIRTSLFVPLIFSFIAVKAQEGPVNSGKLIREGIEKYDNEKYEEALTLFKKVPDYDTNGTWAMYEAAMALNALERNQESYDVLKRLVNEFKYLNPNTFNLWGNVADDKGDAEDGLNIYRRGLRLYPMSNMIAFNAGITFIKKENADSAYVYGMRSANINPMHGSSFNLLGLSNAKQGQVIPAMLCFIHGTLSSLDNRAGLINLQGLNSLASGGMDADLKKATKPYAGFKGAGFKEEDYLITSRSALTASFRKKFKLREATALQTLLLIDLLQEEHEQIPFYGPLMIKFLRQVKAAGLDEVLAYTVFLPTEHPTIVGYIKKNSKKFKQLMEMFYKNVDAYRGKKDLAQYGIPGEFDLTYYGKGGGVETATSTTETSGKGYATYLYGSDGRLLLSGYTKNKKWEGEALYYDAEGNIEERRNYTDGKQVGETRIFYPDGTLHGIVTLPKNETTDTLRLDFFYRDGKTPDFSYKKVNGKYEGVNRLYFPDGSIKLIIGYKNGQWSGTRTEYYECDDLKKVENFKEGKKDGPATYYYVGGQKSSEGSYKAGALSGEWKSYYHDGKLESVNRYDDKGVFVGKGEEYYENGGIYQTHDFDASGNQNGTIKIYGLDGKVHTEFTFANKKVKACKTFDANGNVVYNTVTANKKLEFYKNDRYHKLLEKGVIENDERVGTFVEYRNGTDTAAVTPYNKKGEIDGEAKTFYESGTLKEITTYKNGLQDGKYAEYNINGSVSYYGFYVNGSGEGYWRYYNDNGTIREIRFFRDDEKHGRFDYFDSKGQLVELEYYDEGKKTKEIKFENGVAVDTIDMDRGITNVDTKYSNGKPKEKYTILNGVIHGTYTRFYPNGQAWIVAEYKNGYSHGSYKRYYPDGKLMSDIPQVMNRNHGKAVYYGENGKIERETEYLSGEMNGTHTIYYATGKKFKETQYRNDKIDGARTVYAPDGKIVVKLFYERDYLIGYTYSDKSGNLLPMIPVVGGSGKVVAYYPSGDKSCDFNFKKSYFDGKQTAYYPGTDSPIFVENWANFEQDGEQTYYDYGPGKKSSQSGRKKGNYHGFFREYHANGKVAYEAEYVDDEIKDSEKRFNENGTLTAHFTYVNGVILGIGK